MLSARQSDVMSRLTVWINCPRLGHVLTIKWTLNLSTEQPTDLVLHLDLRPTQIGGFVFLKTAQWYKSYCCFLTVTGFWVWITAQGSWDKLRPPQVPRIVVLQYISTAWALSETAQPTLVSHMSRENQHSITKPTNWNWKTYFCMHLGLINLLIYVFV